MDNPFSWDYLTAPIREVPTLGPFSTAFVALFSLSFILAAIVYLTADERFAHNHILRRGVRIGTQVVMWLTGVGLFFFAFRAMRVEFLTLYMRLWSYLFFVVYVGVMTYFAYWLKVSYPRKKDEIERLAMRRKYNPNVTLSRRPRRKGRRGIRQPRA